MNFSKVVAAYVKEISKVALKVLELFAEGLGLENKYFEGERSDNAYFKSYYYSLCSDPTSTLGLLTHADVNLLTIVQQDNFGLQFLKDGKWLAIDVIPNALVFGVAAQLQVLVIASFN